MNVNLNTFGLPKYAVEKNLAISVIKRNLSEYAEFSEPDFFAEAFSEFISRKDPRPIVPRPIAKMMGGFIDYFLKG